MSVLTCQVLDKLMWFEFCFKIQDKSTVEPLFSGHLRDLPNCPLNRGCLLDRGCKNCTMFVNNQHSMVTLYRGKVECC